MCEFYHTIYRICNGNELFVRGLLGPIRRLRLRQIARQQCPEVLSCRRQSRDPTLANTDTVTFPLSFYDDITAFQSRTIPVAREGVPAELPRYRHTIGFRGPAQDGPCNLDG